MTTTLFVHSNFPAQFADVARALQAAGGRCAAIGGAKAPGLPGVPMGRYALQRGTTPGIFDPATRAEADMIRGWHAAQVAVALRDQGFVPDVIVGHAGWGETLFLKEVFPAARLIAYAEFYYRSRDADADFDPEFAQPTLEAAVRLHAKSATTCLALAHANAVVSPTAFQASMLPPSLRRGVHLIHEGVDVDALAPRPAGAFRLDDGRTLDGSAPVITFVSRTLEPLRGFHMFMRALPEVLARAPRAEILVIGDPDRTGYGQPPPPGETWKARLLAELGGRLDLSRVHFTGPLPRERYLDALSVSTAHVYLTYPFTLSWSLLEAMAMERLVIGSDTAPVREVIVSGANGRLVDFFDGGALAGAIVEACAAPEAHAAMRAAARRTVVERYDRVRRCTPAWTALVESVVQA